ncbi:MAG: hypothetical protein K2X48_20310 [Chitinophagaceae bacterium]|nr:hypothetical protein [Chitinophagaceae bacterium]
MFQIISQIKKRKLFFLIASATICRLLIAAFTELGNDEVYYYTYALL